MATAFGAIRRHTPLESLRMNSESLEFLRRILETPSPSGYEQPVQQVVREYAATFADDISTDVHGNVILARNPEARLRVMFAGHCDQIGFVVQYIDNEGFVYLQPIGGWDPIVLIGQKLAVWTASGPIFGAIAASRSTCSPTKSEIRCPSSATCGSISAPRTRPTPRPL